MVFYVMQHNETITYLGYSFNTGDKVTIGPNGTYANDEKFTRDKSKGVEVDKYYIGKGTELPFEANVVVRVEYVELTILDDDARKLARGKIKNATIPEVIRTYLTGLHSYTGEFNKEIEPNKFFNPKRTSNPLLLGNNLYYIPTKHSGVSEGKYHLFTDVPGELGINRSSALYAVIYLKDKLPILEELTDKFNKNLDGFNNPICIYRDNINSVASGMLFRDMGIDDLEFHTIDYHRLAKPILKFSEDVPLVEMIPEPVLAFRAFERLEKIDLIYGKYKTGTLDKFYTVIDITDELWKDGNIVPNQKAGKKLKVIYEKGLPIPFIPDVDMPSFNNLKKIAKLNPSCKVIIEDMDTPFITYSFIIECDIGSAIYKSPFSNTIFRKALRK